MIPKIRSGGGRRARAKGIRIRQHPLVGDLRAGATPLTGLILAVGRRSGGAAVRSRVKRVLREAFRAAAPYLPEGSLVTIGTEGDLSRLPRRAISEAAARLLQRLIEQWKASRASRGTSAGASSPSSGFTSS